MLQRLLIKNIALIDRLEIEFGAGLNTLSGETGAGKSVIIDSVNFILGERADRDLIRSGANSAYAEAVFSPLSETARSVVRELFGGGEDEEEEDGGGEDIAVLSRTLTREGKSEIRVNGKAASLSMLKRLGGVLVDIHGQHEHQSLLKTSVHTRIIDYFTGADGLKVKERLRSEFKLLRAADGELRALGGDGEERARRLDMLAYQIKEIEDAELADGEEEAHLARRTVIKNQARIIGGLTAAAEALSGGRDSDGGFSAADGIARAARGLHPIAEFAPEIEDCAAKLDAAADMLNEAAAGINDYLENLDYSERDADALEARLDLIRSLKRKYGGAGGIKNVLEYLARARADFDKLTDGAAEAEKLNARRAEIEARISELCAALTALRRKSAEGFTARAARELQDLGMKNARFTVEFAPNVPPGENGCDSLQFMLSANPGEPLRPLVKVASGGEMSRFMLALKTITADAEDIPTMIFDEIDTGISGKIGQVVACKMADIARRRQVVCVTHMPQIAAMADSAFLISKTSADGQTLTAVTPLSGTAFRDEVSRLTGGQDISTHAARQAADMIAWSARYKAGEG
jgi:DNA repair protein RecN (Recombination protein N)